VDFSLWELGGLERRGRDQLFAPAIHTLQQLKTTFSPQDKLEVVVQTFRAITAQAETANQTWSMDALLPVGQSWNKRSENLNLNLRERKNISYSRKTLHYCGFVSFSRIRTYELCLEPQLSKEGGKLFYFEKALSFIIVS
jgi:hypothetical protein